MKKDQTQNKLKNIKIALRLKGLRCSKGRLAIIHSLLSIHKPISADTLNTILRQSGIVLDKSTLYRALEKYELAGIIEKITTSERVWLYCLSSEFIEEKKHPHFTCSSCHQTYCLDDMQLDLNESLPGGFTTSMENLHLQGICSDCNEIKRD